MMKKFSFVLAAMFLMVFAVGIAGAVSGPPSCSFEASDVSGPEDLTTTFTGTAYNMSAPFSYHWDFGDGVGAEVISVSRVSPITHTYYNPGVYTVSLAVYDTGFPTTMWYESTRTDYITVTNQPPVVSIEPVSQTVHLGERAEFSSTVTGEGIYAYVWNFGDGRGVPPPGSPDSIIPATSTIYERVGEFDTFLVVYNDGGYTTSNAAHVTVIPPVPVADFEAAPLIGQVPLAVQFFDTTPEIMDVSDWDWDFGDGQTSDEQNPLHAYGTVGLKTVTLTVSNGYDSDTETKVAYINVTSESICPICPICPEPEECPECPTGETPTDNIGIFRPSTGHWYLDTDGDRGFNVAKRFGGSTDVPVTGDFNGDGDTDYGIFRPSTGYWYFDYNLDGVIDKTEPRFGGAGDIPVIADYNGDGKSDIGIFRASTGYWYLDVNLDGFIDDQFRFGGSGDIPVTGHWT